MKWMVILSAILIQVFYLAGVGLTQEIQGPMDIDVIEYGEYEGDYIVTDVMGAIGIMDADNFDIKWKTRYPKPFVHDSDVLPSGNIITTDTERDLVYVMDIDTKEIIWEWDPKDPDTIDWEKFGEENGWSEEAISIATTFYPLDGYYTHLNDVDLIKAEDFNQTHDSLLISLRDLDLLIEINFTETKEIIWHHGEPGNTSIINHQHNPDRLPNGNTIICDSENFRIIEVNRNGEIVWEYKDKHLRWARDCDLLPNGNYLITDSNNNRVIEVNPASKEIVKVFSVGVLVPYDAEYIEDINQVAITNSFGNTVMFFDYDTGRIERIIGNNFLLIPTTINLILIIIYFLAIMGAEWHDMKGKSIKERLANPRIYEKVVPIVVMILFVLFMYDIFAFMNHFITWHIQENIPRPHVRG